MTTTQLLTRIPAVLIASAALVAAAPTSTPTAPAEAQAAAVVGDCTPGSDWGTVRADFASRVVDLVNQHRTSRGLSQLSVTTAPTNSAVWKARHMARYAYMSHNDPAPPVARSTSQRMAACGVTGGWGENIAYGYATPEAVMQGWLNSPGHRANIENGSYRSIGVGAATSSSGRVYWAQAFSTQTGGSTPPPPPPPAPKPACSNGLDDDGDTKVDYPADPGCTSSSDTNEYNAPPSPPPSTPACSNSKDDDGDGKVDYPADPGCTSSSDNDEYNAPPAPAPPPSAPACSNGRDDDADGRVDYPADPGCTSASDTNEFNLGIFF